ncbi:MAG: hypothetical protein OXG52_02215 [bacterium]|nr:hypothetical protein [bacterium]
MKETEGVPADSGSPKRPPPSRTSEPSAHERERMIDVAIVEGYRRQPMTPDEDRAALESLREAVFEEPW